MVPVRYLLSLLLLLGACSPDTGSGDGAVARAIQSPSGDGASLPRLATSPADETWLSWVEPQSDGSHVLLFSILRGDSWTTPRKVASGTDWFVNWADFPSVVPLDNGQVAAHWLVKRPGGTYAYDVAVALSRDGGQTWSDTVTPHSDGTATEHGFVTLFPQGEGVGAVWLDGREMAEDGDGASGHGHGDGGMTLRYGLIDMSRVVQVETLLDDLTCDCCQTGVASRGGEPVVVYRDRSRDEIRDVYATAMKDEHWSEPEPVARDGWRIAACPVNGPAIDAQGDELAVAWFSAAGDRPAVRLAFSGSGASGFGPVHEIDDGRVIGRVDVVMLDDSSAVVSWMQAVDDDTAEIRYRRITSRGKAGETHVVSRIPAGRSSGFPQMSPGGEGLVFAWTLPGNPSQVITATAPLPPS